MYEKRLFLRSADADDLLENFLVAGVVTILLIRAFLKVTGYPQLGSGIGLHIAHMLWGGLLMLVALFLCLAFLDRTPRRIAALLGGVGFGAFIDELGKFITRDNDYFYQPTIALIYTVFVLLFLLVRILEHDELTATERAVNGAEIAKQAVAGTLGAGEKAKALYLLRGTAEAAPGAAALSLLIADAATLPHRRHFWYSRLQYAFVQGYRAVAANPLFERLVIFLFVTGAALRLLTIPRVIVGAGMTVVWAIALFAAALAATDAARMRRKEQSALWGSLAAACFGFFLWSLPDAGIPRLPGSAWGEILFYALAGLMIVGGVMRMRTSRIAAYQWFSRAILVSLFFGQFFLFYRLEFLALPGLLADIVVLVMLRYALRAEATLRAPRKKAA